MPKLNDTHLILLSAAAARGNQSFFPLPETLAKAGARVPKALAELRKHGFVDEHETAERACVWRTNGDLRFGLFLTPAGAAAINVGDIIQEGTVQQPDAAVAPKASKSATVVALLEREEGATLAELIAATGWLPHTTRAALTGLRKKGHVVDRTRRDAETCYRIAAA